MRHLTLILLALTLGMTGARTAAGEDWPRWTGPRGDFSALDPGLADTWPADGLPTLWQRSLGEGYSGISVSDGRLFTMFGEGDEEVILCLDTDSGDQVWSYRYVANRYEGMRLGHGEGPHTTPTVVGETVFAIGTTSMLSALDARTGELRWQVDLWAEYGSGRLRRGYGSSPLAHDGRLLVPLGGDGGIVALDPATGELVWRQTELSSAQSSPVVIDVDGDEQLILFAQDEVVGMDPEDGDVLWRVPHESFGPYNISTPVWGADGLLFVSSAYGGGGRGIEVSAPGGVPQAATTWTSNRLGIHFTNAVRIDDTIYGSAGRGGVVTTALDATTGELLWRTREIGRANFLVVGQRVLALEEDGRLLFGRLSREGFARLAEDQIFDGRSWTVPTLVGSTLYVRDRDRIAAFALPLVD